MCIKIKKDRGPLLAYLSIFRLVEYVTVYIFKGKNRGHGIISRSDSTFNYFIPRLSKYLHLFCHKSYIGRLVSRQISKPKFPLLPEVMQISQ